MGDRGLRTDPTQHFERVGQPGIQGVLHPIGVEVRILNCPTFAHLVRDQALEVRFRDLLKWGSRRDHFGVRLPDPGSSADPS
jgi:hypothetical protein